MAQLQLAVPALADVAHMGVERHGVASGEGHVAPGYDGKVDVDEQDVGRHESSRAEEMDHLVAVLAPDVDHVPDRVLGQPIRVLTGMPEHSDASTHLRRSVLPESLHN